MLIMSQNKRVLFNLNNAATLFLSSCYGDYNGGPVKVLTSYPIGEDATENLGEYESEARALEVLEEIAVEYGKYMKVDVGYNSLTGAYTPPFAFDHPKVYKMPKS